MSNLSLGNGIMDCIKSNKFALVKNILKKVVDTSQLVYTNAEGQNLWHTIAIHSKVCPPMDLLNIIQTFKDIKEIDFCATDLKKRSQLHMAALCNNTPYLKFILNNVDMRDKVLKLINTHDSDNNTVFSLILQNNYNN